MRAGDLRERVTFAERIEEDDGHGNKEGDFVDRFTVAAGMEPRFGGEAVMAARLSGRQPVSIVIRYFERGKSITPAWRATNARSGEIYNIRSVVVGKRRDLIELLCEAGVDA